MRRQKKPLPKIRPLLPPPPPQTQARMDAYWYVTREEVYMPWTTRQRSFSFQNNNQGYPSEACLVHHYGPPPRMAPPPPPAQYQPLPIHMPPRPFDLDDSESRIPEPYYMKIRRNKTKGSQRFGDIRNLSKESPGVSKNVEEIYGYLPLQENNWRDEKGEDAGEVVCEVNKGSGVYTDDDEDEDDEKEESFNYSGSSSTKSSPDTPKIFTNRRSSSSGSKRPSKLKRRKAYYRDKKDGRSRSLTHIDNLDPAMLLRQEDMDSRSEPDTSTEQLLYVPSSVETRESRRKKLARSQVSSSEFFSVCFEGELGNGLEEFIPATKGMLLGDALRPLLEKKNVNFSSVNIFVDSSKTPLPSPAHTDTYFVAGKNLIVRAKDDHDAKFHSRSFKQPSRKPSHRSKGRFFSASTEDTNYVVGSPTGVATLDLANSSPVNHSQTQSSISHEGSLKVKNTKQSNRWSGLFSNSIKDNSKMDLLVEQLNNYSKNGIPNLLGLDSVDSEDPISTYSVEEDWKAIIGGWNVMSERARQQQIAIWELVETEVVYLRTIKVITDLFLACLYNLQSSNILNEIDRDQLFSNIPEIYKSNRVLWLDCISPMVQKARESNEPLKPSELRNGFLKFGSTCQPYIRYCLDQTKCQQYCREKYHENELFKAYLAWCETRKECNRLRLMDILVRPMQRMTKYSLLLKAILKHTEEPEQRKSLEEMISSVERFVKSVNGALRSRQDSEKIQAIQEKIEAYDVVETREDELEVVVKQHSKLDLFHPMPGCGSTKRWLIYEGDLKIKDFNTKLESHCFLFTDMFLVCKCVGKKGDKLKVIRQPYVVDRLLARELKDPSAFGLIYVNEYSTAIAALTLHPNESKSVKTWIEQIKKAQKCYTESKLRESNEYPGDILEEDEGAGIIYLSSRSPLPGSSRGSQLSSLVHSHSGSVEMNEVSNISSRGISFEHELRGSSLSSEDGTNGLVNDGTGIRAHSLNTETPHRPSSPRIERRVFLSKSPTPNTLSVQIPIPNLSGQSLPNLSSVSESLPPSYSIHSLVVPKSFLSPTHRGVSYPPPSPRNLTRSHAVSQSRNPPLQKSKNILSPEVAKSLDVQIPQFKGVTPPSNDVSPVNNPPPPTPTSATQSMDSKHSEHFFGEYPPEDEIDGIRIVHKNPDGGDDKDVLSLSAGCSKRLARNERADTKRYYTAGAIEDFKKENLKDSSIHKRFSWNYGPQQQQSIPKSLQSHPDPLKNRQFFSNESMASIRSSSGVSSTSSLLHCISDLETQMESPIPYHPDVRIDVSEPDSEVPGEDKGDNPLGAGAAATTSKNTDENKSKESPKCSGVVFKDLILGDTTLESSSMTRRNANGLTAYKSEDMA